jgi:hypothetical protein
MDMGGRMSNQRMDSGDSGLGWRGIGVKIPIYSPDNRKTGSKIPLYSPNGWNYCFKKFLCLLSDWNYDFKKFLYLLSDRKRSATRERRGLSRGEM